MRPTYAFFSAIFVLTYCSTGQLVAQNCNCAEQSPAPVVQGGCSACNAGCDSGGCADAISGCDDAGCCGGCVGSCHGGCRTGLMGKLKEKVAELRCRSGAGTNGQRCEWYRPFTENSQADLFYNYYQPNNNGSTAAAFPAPYPTPSVVGHTYFTYQPFYPTELLYRHHRTYHQYYNNGMGLNRTKVRWSYNPLGDMIRKAHKMTVYR